MVAFFIRIWPLGCFFKVPFSYFPSDKNRCQILLSCIHNCQKSARYYKCDWVRIWPRLSKAPGKSYSCVGNIQLFLCFPVHCSSSFLFGFWDFPQRNPRCVSLNTSRQSIEVILDFVPLERTNECKFTLFPVHVVALAELPVFMTIKEKSFKQILI